MLDDFFLRALLAGVGVALIAGPLGCFIVWRRLAYFGDTMAHSALLGIALAALLDLNLILGVFVVAVGVALALTLLSGLPTAELLAAIQSGDSKKLVRIPGVGKKTGERIVLELKDKLGTVATGEDGGEDGAGAVEEDVITALISLGCSADAANRAVRKARQDGAPAEFETLFRQAMELIKR